MPFQSSLPEDISSTEAQALARFVHDLEIRMKLVTQLLQSRGTEYGANLAESIVGDLQALERELSDRKAPACSTCNGRELVA